MKEKDIKTLFAKASYTEEDNVNTEEIKSDVLKKLSKTAAIAPTLNEEGVKPVFVAQKARKFPVGKTVAAAATAACLSVVSISTGFFGLAGAEQIALSSDTDVAEEAFSANENEEEITDFKNGAVTLKDGTKVSMSVNSSDSTKIKLILAEKNKKVYFLGDEQAVDITDEIRTDDPIIIPYENEGSDKTHYIIIGGDVATGDYGYVEIFKNSENKLYTHEVTNNYTGDPSLSLRLTETEWFKNAIEQLSDELEIDPEKPYSFGGSGWDTDFRDSKNWIKEITSADSNKEDTFRFVLLDGSTVMNIGGKEETTVNGGTGNLLLSEENGRLYFVKNAGEINIFDKGAAIKEDITDKISYDDFYIYSYENSDNKEYSTQYVIVGGSIEDYDYGYVELYMANGKWNSYDRFGINPPAMPRYLGEIRNTPGDRWFINAVLELEKNYGEQIFGNYYGGSGKGADFKYVWTNDVNENDLVPKIPDDPKTDTYSGKWLGEKSKFKNDNFTLMDGTSLTVTEGDIISIESRESPDASKLLSEKDGRLYYLGDDEPKDITDLISMDTPFIVTYENEGSGLTHYIAVGGDVASGKYGYAEMFMLYERKYYYSSCNYSAEPMAHDPHLYYAEWFRKAVKEMGGEYADSYLSNGLMVSCDFTKVEF